MTTKIKMLAFGISTAALATATPATAQYYGYRANNTQMAADRCAAAVQSRLSYGTSTNIFGIRTASAGRVLSVTRVNPNRNTVRVRGLATSGSGYGPYGVGLYGTLGYQQRADLSFKCDVDYRGYVRDIDINRR